MLKTRQWPIKNVLPLKKLRREDTGRSPRKFFNLKILKNSKLKGSYQRNSSQIGRMFTIVRKNVNKTVRQDVPNCQKSFLNCAKKCYQLSKRM
jgi:hypothetical protein